MASERITYREAFLRELGLDPFTASLGELRQAARKLGFSAGSGARPPSAPPRDELLDFLMGAWSALVSAPTL